MTATSTGEISVLAEGLGGVDARRPGPDYGDDERFGLVGVDADDQLTSAGSSCGSAEFCSLLAALRRLRPPRRLRAAGRSSGGVSRFSSAWAGRDRLVCGLLGTA